MKHLTLFFTSFCLLIVYEVYPGDTTFLWPVKGKPPGSNILYQPNDYLGDEQVYSDLIISTGNWDSIVSPVDGVIIDFNFTYKQSLSSGVAYSPAHYFDKSIDSTLKNIGKPNIQDSKYFTASISLLSKDGKKIFLTGFIPSRWFKTGERLKKGEILGKASYAYHKIPEQCLFINVSRNAVSDDPMSPFGLKSSFAKALKRNNKVNISEIEMLEDISVLEATLREGHPGLFDYVSEPELQMAFDNLRQKAKMISGKQDFENLLIDFLRLIRDSHLSITNKTQCPLQSTNPWAAVSFGFLNDSLVINRTVAEYSAYLGRRISMVNGFDVDTIKKAISRTIGGHDGFVESYPDFVRLTLTSIRFFHEFFPFEKSRDLDILFYNGEGMKFKGSTYTQNSCPNYYPSWRDYYNYPDRRFFTSMISDTIAHVGLSTFDLNDLEMIEIQDFIQSLNSANCKSLIIDLRNNYGGNSENLSTLFDLISKNAFRLNDHMVVNSNTTYSFFKYADNYSINDTLFRNYSQIANKSGYYLEAEIIEKKISDDKTFKGDVYVLVNERSFSSAAVFAGLVKKYNRGLIVGRETGSAYYQINALRFVTLMLPNSKINIRIPLIKIVFDTVQRQEIPWGRGVIPDVSIDFSLDELEWKSDTILKTTLDLILEQRRLTGNKINEGVTIKMADSEADHFDLHIKLILTGIALVFFIIFLVLYFKYWRKIST
ncbi:MAG: S41 family peptidase [Bacteroidetes bacterium]|nr:S41 family peptidase [Bacteroidota bacterium]